MEVRVPFGKTSSMKLIYNIDVYVCLLKIPLKQYHPLWLNTYGTSLVQNLLLL